MLSLDVSKGSVIKVTDIESECDDRSRCSDGSDEASCSSEATEEVNDSESDNGGDSPREERRDYELAADSGSGSECESDCNPDDAEVAQAISLNVSAAISRESYSGYGHERTNHDMITGARILRRTLLASDDVLPPRISHTSTIEMHPPVEFSSKRKDIVAFAVRFAKDAVHQHSFIRNGKDDDIPEYSIAAGFEIEPLQPGWAKRPKHGRTKGLTFVKKYEKEIEELFLLGVNEPSKKMSPDMMIAELQKRYPGQFALPGYADLRLEISKRLARMKKNPIPTETGQKRIENCTSRGKRGRKPAFDEKYQNQIKLFIHNDITVKPKVIVTMLKTHFLQDDDTLPDDFPASEQSIKTFSSNYKTKLKKSS